MPTALRSPRPLFVLFFLSGMAALLYQVVWQRLLVFYTGSDTVSISLIVTAFMTGLGVGYLLGGTLADRATPAQNLRYFLLAETGILLCGAVSKWVLYDWLYIASPISPEQPVVLYVVLFAVLLLPTLLMGVSLPVLARAFRGPDVSAQARYVGALYGVNTLGAAVGALLTGAFLVRSVGFANALWFGVALNGLCALGAAWLGRGLGAGDSELSTENPASPAPSPEFLTPSLFLWSGQYFIAGLAALALELLWFRVLETLIKSVSLTFSLLLAVYLGSLALGTAAGAWWLRGQRSEWPRPAPQRERSFLWAQTLLYGWVAASLALFLLAVPRLGALDFLWQYFGGVEPVLSPRFAIWVYGLLPLWLLAVPTFLMGWSFSVSQSLVQDRFETVGRRVGWLQFVNIVGSAVGAAAITWIGFPEWGSATLFRFISALGFVYLGLLFARGHLSALTAGGATLALLLALLLIPKNDQFWRTVNGMHESPRFLYDENESSISVIKVNPDGRGGIVFVNGLGQSGLPFRTDEIHTLLGALPAMLHPAPRHVAVVGLGSGGTVHAIAGRPETERVDCFEIATNQAQVLAEYAAHTGDSAVSALLQDRRLNLILRDGRYVLRHNAAQYDIIEADALRPSSAYSGNVYSKEYFELVRSRLRPGGLAVTWCPTMRVYHSFRATFPYVMYCSQTLLIGSNQPITVRWDDVMARARHPFAQQHYGQAGIDIVSLLERHRPEARHLAPGLVRTGEVNTDLFPKDEYSLRAQDRVVNIP